MRYERQTMQTYTVNLSNGKSLKVTAPSEQRAYSKVEKLIKERGSKVTVTTVDPVK